MEIKKYFDNKKHFQSLFYQFIGNSNDDNLQFQNNFINENKYLFDVEELKHFLRFISTISGNINRYQQNIIDKTKFILLNYKNEIKQTLSNFELFQIFKDNKLILLFLFENEMIHFDIYIEDSINMMKFEDGTEYCHFFYPEIKNAEKKYIFNIKTIENELFEIDPKIFEEFEKKRQIGENDSYLCSLIRNDEAIEFISYVNRMNISLNSFVKSSIFETNSFLVGKKTTLIEYAAFFGSIQIFQYLRLNGVDLNPSIWLYAIHSNNPELIHLLEEEKIINNDQEYEKCFEESIKCHHNEIANYIKDVLMMKLPENLYLYAIKYCNYLFLPEEIDVLTAFFYLCHFNFYKIVNFYLKEKENEIETIIVLKYIIFNSVLF